MHNFLRPFTNVYLRILSYIIFLILQFTLTIFLITTYSVAFNGLIRVSLIFIVFVASAQTGNGVISSIMLYKPLQNKNWEEVNYILSNTHKSNITLAKIGISILALLIIGYGTFIYWANSGISIKNEDGTLDQHRIYIWYIMLIILLIASRDLISMVFVGARENLLKSDNNSFVCTISLLITQILVYLFSIWLISKKPLPFIPFLPFLLFSPVYSLFIYWFTKHNYPWLDLRYRKKNRLLGSQAIFAGVKRGSYSALLNSDIIVISLILGLRIGSALSFYLMISIFLRNIVVNSINAFDSYYGGKIAYEGRLHWKKYRRLELLTYSLAAFAFINQFISSPYLVNVLFNNHNVINTSKFHLQEKLLFNWLFLKPDFSLLIALITTIAIMTEPFNLLIYAKNHFKKTYKLFLCFAIFKITLSVIGALIIRFVNNDYIQAVEFILITHIIVLFIQYCYLWIYNWFNWTYNSKLSSFIPNFALLVGPIVITCLIFYFVIYPDQSLTYNQITIFQPDSLVSRWSLSKLSLFLFVVFISAFSVNASTLSFAFFWKNIKNKLFILKWKLFKENDKLSQSQIIFHKNLIIAEENSLSIKEQIYNQEKYYDKQLNKRKKIIKK